MWEDKKHTVPELLLHQQHAGDSSHSRTSWPWQDGAVRKLLICAIKGRSTCTKPLQLRHLQDLHQKIRTLPTIVQFGTELLSQSEKAHVWIELHVLCTGKMCCVQGEIVSH